MLSLYLNEIMLLLLFYVIVIVTSMLSLYLAAARILSSTEFTTISLNTRTSFFCPILGNYSDGGEIKRFSFKANGSLAPLIMLLCWDFTCEPDPEPASPGGDSSRSRR